MSSFGFNFMSEPSGLVFKKSQGTYFVRAAGGEITCSISNRLRKQLVYPIAAPTDPRRRGKRVIEVQEIDVVDPIAVGDYVDFTPAGDGTGVITAVQPRRNALVRPAAGPKQLEQVIVSNVDLVVAVMAAAQPAPVWNLLDRYLAAAEGAGVPALICLTKTDLCDELPNEVHDYERIGYRVLGTSSASGLGLDALREALRGRVSAFVGKSGVGKSSLLNAIQPGLGLRVNAVSQTTGKGRHTTTALEMFTLDFGGQVVDTPGMREFGLKLPDDFDLAEAFVEMRPYLGRCKFGAGCRHDQEPGCAVCAAVESGAIAERRWQSYLRLLSEVG